MRERKEALVDRRKSVGVCSGWRVGLVDSTGVPSRLLPRASLVSRNGSGCGKSARMRTAFCATRSGTGKCTLTRAGYAETHRRTVMVGGSVGDTGMALWDDRLGDTGGDAWKRRARTRTSEGPTGEDAVPGSQSCSCWRWCCCQREPSLVRERGQRQEGRLPRRSTTIRDRCGRDRWRSCCEGLHG